MPRKRGGICACFGGGDTPEITIDMDKLQQMKAEEPMPPIDELDAKFEELVVSLIICNLVDIEKTTFKSTGKWNIS